MREIKFRAYCNHSKKMFNIISMAYFNRKQNIHKLLCYENEETSIHEPEKLFDFELMQYTGLKDRDGVEIYEGDLVEFHTHYFNGGSFDNDLIAIGVVEITEYCELCIKVLKRKQGSLNNKYFHVAETTHFEESCIKVLGNIHQHPELLEAE